MLRTGNKIIHFTIKKPSDHMLLGRSHTTTVAKFKSKSTAAQTLASDDTGKHPHILDKFCIDVECFKKQCSELCNNFYNMKTRGFFTHSPIVGKYCRYVHEYDANYKKETQYYVKNTDPDKQADPAKIQSFKDNDIKVQKQMEIYIQSIEIKTKIHN